MRSAALAERHTPPTRLGTAGGTVGSVELLVTDSSRLHTTRGQTNLQTGSLQSNQTDTVK